MRLPLEGLLVVSVEQAVAAPLCSQRLAEAGARVVKVERAEGDFARAYDGVVHGESAYFVWLNHGKESLVADLKSAADIILLRRMIGQADVFIQNLGPGAAVRAGLGSADLRQDHPRLITCDISGYGVSGPYRDMKAYDLLIQAETGLADITGGPAEPGRVGVSVADIACGLNAYSGILEALFQREQTGEGSSIEVSLFDGLAEWMAVPLLHSEHGGRAPARVGLRHPSIAPYGGFETGDGRRIVIAVQNEREWLSFREKVLGPDDPGPDPRFATNSLRVANRDALEAVIASAFASVDAETLGARLRSAKIAFGRLNTVSDLSTHPQLRRRQVQTASGPASLPAPAVIFTDRPLPSTSRAPALGAQSDAIRAEFTAPGASANRQKT